MNTIVQRNPVANFFAGLKNRIIRKCVSLVCVLLVLQAAGFAQTAPSSKIDPVFRIMLDRIKDRSLSQTDLPARLRIEPTKGFAARGSQPEERYECIVYTKNAQALRDSNIVLNSVLPGFVTAWATPAQIVQLSQMAEVLFIEAPKVDYPSNDVAVGGSGAALLHQGALNNTPYKGKNVIVAIYDTGIDWDHLDFRNPADTTKSRILRIWDQTLTANTTAGEAPPGGFSYGVEYTQTQISDELDGTPTGIVRERDANGHGTHVAGTAAGNGSAMPSRRYTGMAPEADIVVIKGGENSFNESRMIDGLTYLRNLATTLGKAVVVNWSIGSQTGAHDGSRAYEKAVDNFTASAPGRLVSISAGNDNNSNLHNRIVLAAFASASFSFAVSDSTASDVFEYRIYANDNSPVTATITAPDGTVLSAPADQSRSQRVLSDSFTVFLFNQIDAANQNRYVDVYLNRTGTNTRRPTGTWTVNIANNSANTLTMDGWLYYRNAAFTATSIVGGNSDYMVSSPGNAASAITVASYVGKNHWYANSSGFSYSPSIRQDSISTFSSRGPRRDGVLKPDIAAHGQAVASCLSSDAVANYTVSRIAEPGLYAINQGTSMASPGVAGAVALLLQANPGATAAQIKSLLLSTANKDGMTEVVGASPNPVWGAGRLDVFKAASLLFNCGPSDRRTIKYDSSTNSTTEEGGTTYSTQRLAVRFTPDVTGKLGGVLFHTSLTATGLFAEVRTSEAGLPGSLLGSMNIDSGKIARYTFNYADLSSLNIPVTSGTDYFIILGRAAGSTANWSLRSEIIAVDGRSLQSINGGISWTTLGSDLKMRSVVYNNAQLGGAIATTNSSDSRGINTSNQFINANCQLINQLVPGGTSPVSGNVTGKVWIEGSVPRYAGKPYVQRHYDIAAASAGTSGRITLYFTQAEFSAFNTDGASTLDLPANGSDVAGVARLRIGKYAGSSSDGSGQVGTYPGEGTVIDPVDADIVYNAGANRWEVSFDDTGFGGFFVQTETVVLPIIEEYFRGMMQRTANNLHWKISCTTSAILAVERSANGTDFNSIGRITATQYDCAQPFSFTDVAPLAGNNYYRIRIVQPSGNVLYTSTILLQNDRQLATRLFPTLLHTGARVQVSLGDAAGYLVVTDATGKQVVRRTLTNGVQSIDLGLRIRGIYFYTIKKDQTVLAAGKIVVE